MYDDVLSALDVISRTSSEVLRALQTRDVYARAWNTLKASKPKAAEVDSLLEQLRVSLPGIEEYLQKDPTAAVGSPSWERQDPRLTDIAIATGSQRSLDTRFRAFLAYRSFGLEFEGWQLQNGFPSRVDD